jgi:alpha-L-rhamnosidase
MSDTRVIHLRCEYLVDPLGLDERIPRLGWQLESARRGARQVAYRVRVASAPEILARGGADRWDSGRVESDRTTHVEYAGAALRSRDACHWDVEIWDETGARVRSVAARWTMGLLERDDWTARWIAPAANLVSSSLTEPGMPVVFRKHFAVPAPVRRATVYVTARGIFDLRIGGQSVSEDRFAPEWTDYDKRIQYRTYDVTALLAAGENTLEATLADGWWSGFIGWQETRARYGTTENSLCVQLELEFANGERCTVATDGSWGCTAGPIQSADFQMGEVCDARREPGAAGWEPVREVPPPSAVLVAQRSQPVRIVETLPARSRTEVKPGVFIFDLGQNIAGWVRLRLRGVAAGTRITLRHGERLNPEGTLYTENLRRAKATDVYIARGASSADVARASRPWTAHRAANMGETPMPRDEQDHGQDARATTEAAAATEMAPEETWEPLFTFHGFQYFELTLELPEGKCHLLNDTSWIARAVVAEGRAIQSATPPAGHFECSHAGVNRLWLNGVWSQRDNFLSVPTDCPQRDERLGWMGDAQVFLRTASYNSDVAAFFTKWMIDVEDAQTAEGIFPDVAPRIREDFRFVGLDGLGGAAGWADAGVIVPWTIWRVYGDRRILERHWSAMVKWLEWIDRKNPRGLREHELGNNYGDWLCIPTDTTFRTHSPMKTLLATAYWADDAAKVAQMARALGRESEAERFGAMFERVRAAFQKEWLRDDGRLAVETQTAYLLALAFDLLPERMRARAAAQLVENIRALDWHLSTGFIGISHLNPQLTLAGRADVAYRLLLQDTFPSWLYPVQHGATTIWERWNGWTHQDGFFNPQMNSFNHYSLGSVGEWLFRHVAGIELDPERPGFQRFVLRPFVGGGLEFARATYRTLHGEIESHWRRTGEKLEWTVRVPANCTARVFIPGESGTPVETHGLAVVGREPGFAICEAGAGCYELRSTLRVNGGGIDSTAKWETDPVARASRP